MLTFKKSLMAVFLLSFILGSLTFANLTTQTVKYNHEAILYTGYTELVPGVNAPGWYDLMSGDMRIETFYWDGTYVYEVDKSIPSAVVLAHE